MSVSVAYIDETIAQAQRAQADYILKAVRKERQGEVPTYLYLKSRYLSAGIRVITNTNHGLTNAEIEDEGQKIIVYGSLTGAQELIITPNDINKYIVDDGYEATGTVTGSFSLTKQEKEFVISKFASQPFRSLAYKTGGAFLNCQNNIPSGNSYAGTIVGTGLANNKVCLYSRSIGINADFLSSTGKDLTEVSINVGGATGILKPAEKKSITLSDGTIVTFVGSLNSVESITVPSADVLFDAGVFKKLIKDGAHVEHEGEEDKFTTCAGIGGKDLDSGTFNALSIKTSSKITSCIQDFNVKIQTNVLEDITDDYDRDVGVDSPSYFTPNSIRVHLKRPTSYPTVTIELDASKVAIRKLKGKPDIQTCVPDKEIFSGDTYISSVNVKNIGKTSGEFGGTIQCTNSVSGSITSGFVQKDSSINLPVSVSGTNANLGTTQNSKCTISLEDSNGGGTDSCQFNLGVKYQGGVVCVPDSIKCASSTNLRTCNEGGSNFVDTKCDYGCVTLESGESQCKSSGQSCSSNTDCKTGETCDGGVCIQGGQCIQESQKISSGENCCAGLEKKGGFLFLKKATCEKTFPKCENMKAVGVSKLLGGIFPKLKCDTTTWQGLTAWARLPLVILGLLLIPVIFLFELIFTGAIFGKLFRRNKGLAWLLGFIVAGVVAVAFYLSWITGLILAGILLFIQITMGVVSLFRRRR